MYKVFLSHSSNDNGYVEIIAKKLGLNNIEYDSMTFESSRKTIDEIYRGLDQSGIFVYFISDSSLDKDWVKLEINTAEYLLTTNSLKYFIPIIIDEKITYQDPRIPEWIVHYEFYNLRYVSRPAKAFEIIRHKLIQMKWEINPLNKKYRQLFVGRNEQRKAFEERYYSTEFESIPTSVIVSGLPNIGRKKCITHFLQDVLEIEASYTVNTISLNYRNSIEDFILQMYDLGFSSLTKNDIIDNLSKSLVEKVSLSTRLAMDLYNNRQVLFIDDDSCIVDQHGLVSQWYISILNDLRVSDKIVLIVISKRKVRQPYKLDCGKVFCLYIPELLPIEREGFFKKVLSIESIQLKEEDIKVISSCFNGFPKQIRYAVEIIKSVGLDHLKNNLYEINEYNNEFIAKCIQKYENNVLAMQLLVILSMIEFISFSVVKSIVNTDYEIAVNLLEEFHTDMVIDLIGGSKEYIRLNSVFVDYVQRSGIRLQPTYRDHLLHYAKDKALRHELIESDLSEYLITYKIALKNNPNLPDNLLFPSIYVNTMRELYGQDKKYQEVIDLSKRILQNEKMLDPAIVREIRYWLCLSLARLKNRDVLTEVKAISHPEDDFIRGFYYRITQQYDNAINALKRVIRSNSYHSRAKRELVIVYQRIGLWNEALDYARDNYESEKNNPFHIQSYFISLLRQGGSETSDELAKLLKSMELCTHERAREMFITLKSQYLAFNKKEYPEAIRVADSGIKEFPDSIYPVLSKLDILIESRDFTSLVKFVNEIERCPLFNKNDTSSRITYIISKTIVQIQKGKSDEAYSYLKKRLEQYYPLSVVELYTKKFTDYI